MGKRKPEEETKKIVGGEMADVEGHYLRVIFLKLVSLKVIKARG